MALIRWDPFRLAPRGLWQWPSLLEEELLEWPEISEGLTVYETDDEVVIQANVAGVKADEVDVSLEGGTITIKAEHEETEEEKKKKKVVYRQAKKARYLYTTSIPCPVKADKAVATLQDGVLTVTLPKEEAAKPKKVKVKVKK